MNTTKLWNAVKHPLGASILSVGYKHFYYLPDKIYLKALFGYYLGYKLNLENPVTFNEKLQWLKLYNRNPDYTIMVDKYKVRDYVESSIGGEYLIPLLGVWRDPNEINFDNLPNQFVLKCNHNSGTGMCICKDKSSLDISAVIAGLQRGLDENYYLLGREWPYKNVNPLIIAEKYMEDPNEKELRDYKILCFNGEPKLIEYHANRFTDSYTQDFYDTQWNHLNIRQTGLNCMDYIVEKPVCLEEMLDLSRCLAKNTPHVRIDWYVIDGKLYFGEITFFDGSGFCGFEDYQMDLLLGSWIDLSSLNK